MFLDWKIITVENVFHLCASYSVKPIITSFWTRYNSLLSPVVFDICSNFKNGDFNALKRWQAIFHIPAGVSSQSLYIPSIVDHNRGRILECSWVRGLLSWELIPRA
jgi:hypothetical protein